MFVFLFFLSTEKKSYVHILYKTILHFERFYKYEMY